MPAYGEGLCTSNGFTIWTSKTAKSEQSVHEARKQAVTRRMNEIPEKGRRTASALKVGLKQHLGNRDEELVKFGIQPLRARKRRKNVRPVPEGEGPRPPAIFPHSRRSFRRLPAGGERRPPSSRRRV
jgi:hypothetical protein